MQKHKYLSDLLSDIYPDSYGNIFNVASEILNGKDIKERSNGWYKAMNLYVTYPDTFELKGKRDLFALSKRIGYIKKLGCNALHILPFLDSPMIDGRFDIKDYLNVEESLGGIEGINAVMSECKKQGINIFMDLVMNHVSDQHEWFQKALDGDEKYRKYFIHMDQKPVLVRTYEDDLGHWAEYDFNGYIQAIRIIFPQFVKELPHWIQGKDGYWYYHTFYPYQPDLDWNNSDVFVEFIKIIKFWAEKGMSFRLDAITFMGKDVFNGVIESNPKLHKIIKALNYIVKQINPNSVFLAETCQPVHLVKKYFGDNNIESELIYNFKMTQSIWYSYLSGNPSNIAETLEENFMDIPDHASWINFLRNHDELSLEFAEEHIRQYIYSNLIKYGLDFREGFGVTGRTLSLVKGKFKDLLFLYKVLASLPGTMAIIYGDELGKKNDFKFMKKQVVHKEKVLKLEHFSEDTRDISRGTITSKNLIGYNFRITNFLMSKIFKNRLKYIEYFKKPPTSFMVNQSTLTLEYNNEGKILLIEIDFKKKQCDWKLK